MNLVCVDCYRKARRHRLRRITQAITVWQGRALCAHHLEARSDPSHSEDLTKEFWGEDFKV